MPDGDRAAVVPAHPRPGTGPPAFPHRCRGEHLRARLCGHEGSSPSPASGARRRPCPTRVPTTHGARVGAAVFPGARAFSPRADSWKGSVPDDFTPFEVGQAAAAVPWRGCPTAMNRSRAGSPAPRKVGLPTWAVCVIRILVGRIRNPENIFITIGYILDDVLLTSSRNIVPKLARTAMVAGNTWEWN